MTALTAPDAMNWSDVARNSPAVAAAVDTNGEVILHRRGEADLMLVRADRQSQVNEVMTTAARLLRRLISNDGPDRAADSLSELYPWLDFLPAADRVTFVKEYARIIQAAADVAVPAVMARFLHDWRATAAIHADPELYAILTNRDGIDDLGPVAVPEPQNAEDAQEG